MGVPSSVWLPLLVVSQVLSLVGLGVGAVYLQHQQLALRELQLHLAVARSPDLLGESWRDRGQLGGAWPGDPEPQPGVSLGSGQRGGAGPNRAEDRDKKVTQNSDSLFWGIVVLVLVLTLLVLTGVIWQRWGRAGGFEELASSPSERRKRLAQRQLAEVRLRKHGFGQ